MLTERQLRNALWCVDQELQARKAGKGRGVLGWEAETVRALELELAVSASGQSGGDEMRPLECDEWIGSVEAARILRWHERKVRRRAQDLDGRKVAGKLVFRASAVHEYAEGLKDARDTA